jgi:hypothetical protein
LSGPHGSLTGSGAQGRSGSEEEDDNAELSDEDDEEEEEWSAEPELSALSDNIEARFVEILQKVR